jgi:hypothetical protein
VREVDGIVLGTCICYLFRGTLIFNMNLFTFPLLGIFRVLPFLPEFRSAHQRRDIFPYEAEDNQGHDDR